MLLGFLLASLAYLLGSVSSAVVVARVFKLADPRKNGSGNPGATNMLRLGGKTPAILTCILDMLKGYVPVMLGVWCHLNNFGLGLVGLLAVLGHIFPCFFDFQGGKGVATMFGVFFAAFPSLAFFMGGIWIGVALVTRYASLASLVAAGAGVLGVLLFHFGAVLPVAGIAAAVTFRHLENIKRLQQGTESQISL